MRPDIGWIVGGGRRADRIGALVLAMADGRGRLRFAGRVGTGFTQQVLGELAGLLAPWSRIRWRLMYPAAWCGLRDDNAAQEVRRE